MREAVRCARFVMVLRLSSAEVERSFSLAKLVGNMRRTSLSPAHRMFETRCRLDKETMVQVLEQYVSRTGLLPNAVGNVVRRVRKRLKIGYIEEESSLEEFYDQDEGE